MTRTRSLYRMFRRADGATPVASIVIAMIVVTCALATVGVIRVSRQHDVLRLGFELSRRSEQVGKLQETRRRVKSNEAPTQTPTQLAFRWEALELPVVQALSCTKWQGG